MKQSIHMALSDYAVQVDHDVRTAIDDYLKPDNIERIVRKYVNQYLEACLREEVKSLFEYSGPGRAVIREAIREKLFREEQEDKELDL